MRSSRTLGCNVREKLFYFLSLLTDQPSAWPEHGSQCSTLRIIAGDWPANNVRIDKEYTAFDNKL